MAVSKDNVRAVVTLPIEVKEKLEKIAEQESRSLSKQIAHIIKEYIKQHDESR